jgi:hypothetical protein
LPRKRQKRIAGLILRGLGVVLYNLRDHALGGISVSGPLTTDRRGQATDAMSRRRRRMVRALTPTAALSLSLNKVDQAHFHLKHLMRETNKPAPVLLAIQSYLGGCVGAAQAAYNNLQTSQPDFGSIRGRWRSTLGRADRRFMDYMTSERNLDVHHGATSLHRNTSKQPGGTDPIPDEFRLRGPVRPLEIVGACRTFIALIEDLTEQFKKSQA